MNVENAVIDRTALKKQAKKILDKKTVFLIFCFLFYGVIVAACCAFCFFVPNPLEKICVDLLSETTLFTEILDYSWLEYITWGVFKFFRLLLFCALVYPFSICMATIPVAIVENTPITWSSTFSPISKARYFIEYMVAGATKFIFVFLWAFILLIPGLVAHYRYSFAKYVFIKNNELTSGEAISQSKKLVRGFKSQLFSLDMSFIGWFVFGVCTCGIGMLYLICYYSVTKVLYYKEIEKLQKSTGEGQ